jgi:hypothetical protein
MNYMLGQVNEVLGLENNRITKYVATNNTTIHNIIPKLDHVDVVMDLLRCFI